MKGFVTVLELSYLVTVCNDADNSHLISVSFHRQVEVLPGSLSACTVIGFDGLVLRIRNLSHMVFEY